MGFNFLICGVAVSVANRATIYRNISLYSTSLMDGKVYCCVITSLSYKHSSQQSKSLISVSLIVPLNEVSQSPSCIIKRFNFFNYALGKLGAKW